MIWQVIVMNGQQKPVAVFTVVVLTGEAITPTAATTRALAKTSVRALAVPTSLSGHLYICKAEC